MLGQHRRVQTRLSFEREKSSEKSYDCPAGSAVASLTRPPSNVQAVVLCSDPDRWERELESPGYAGRYTKWLQSRLLSLDGGKSAIVLASLLHLALSASCVLKGVVIGEPFMFSQGTPWRTRKSLCPQLSPVAGNRAQRRKPQMQRFRALSNLCLNPIAVTHF
jgi:hypothetical protein